MRKSRVLFIAHRIPYPPNKGDKIRSYHMLKYLAERYQVTVACMIDDVADIQYLDDLKNMVHQVFYEVRTPLAMKYKALVALLTGEACTKPCFYSHKLQASIDSFLEHNETQATICFCSQSAAYVFRSRHYQKSLSKKVLLADLVDVDSEKWRQYADQKTGLMRWLYRREADRLCPYEHQIVERFDRTFLVSEDEKSVLAQHGNVDKVEALSNGVDLEYFSPKSFNVSGIKKHSNMLVFSGAMDYWPNIEGALWFSEKVFPVIEKAVPQVKFCIAGRNPDTSILALQKRPGIEVTGTVPDIREYLANAAICVAPLQIARGIQNKVLEGMAMAKTVVSTPGAATGLKAVPGEDIVVAKDGATMASSIIGLLGNLEARQRIGTNARCYVEREHSWDAHLCRLSELIDEGK